MNASEVSFMKYQLHKKEDYTVSRWTGGETTETAIWPASAKYIDRNFIWRLSSATVELDESDFSRLEDYDRVLMVLEGEVVLSHDGQRVARLKELEQDRFDGGWKTKSFGRITDFNLMVRKGNEGYLDLLYPQAESQHVPPSYESSLPRKTVALYCKEGYAVVSCGGESHMVSPEQLLVMEFDKDEDCGFDVMGEGVLIRAQIFYDEMKDELYAEEIPAEKASFDDFRCCIYLANVKFRWAKYIVKRLKTQWFDEALTKAIKKIERFYLTTAVFVIVAVAIAMLNALGKISGPVCVVLLIAWLIADCLLVSPLMYMAVVPKPVRKHIKDVASLTPYEQKVRAEQLGTVEQVEKVLRKYKNSGRNIGQ